MSRPLEEWSRQELIEALRLLQVDASTAQRAASVAGALHELRVHQIELEMQNRELREAQQLLEESRSRYADLYDLAPIGYCTLDARAVILEANIEAARLFGTERSHLRGRPLTSVVSVDFAGLHAHLRACIAGRAPATSELAISLHGGARLIVQLVSTPIVRSDGSPPTTCMTTLTDISALKHSEERLSMLSSVSELLATSLDYRLTLPAVVRLTMPALADLAFVDVCQTDGHLERFVADGARSAPDYAHAPQAEVLRSGTPLLVAEARPLALAAALGGSTHGEPAVDGLAAGSLLLVPLSSRGRTLGVFTFVMGRSTRSYSGLERRLAQEIAARAAMAVESARLYEAAQQAVRAREDVMAVVSHDLSNPLHGMRLNCDHLIESAPPVERRSGRKQVEAIRRGVDRMVRLIRDLSEHARIEAGHLVLEREEHQLSALLGDAFDLLRPLAEQKQLALTQATPVPSVAVWCDRDRVLQVLSNVVGNAIKFTPAGGTLTLDVTVRGDEARLAVSDNAPGNERAQLGHIFERYWKAEQRHTGGSGLGLFIAKSIVEAQGGQIGVDSEVGRGTTVWFTLPVRSGDARAQPARPRATALPSAPLLVVDDDDATREALSDVLASRGYRAQPAANGDEALRYLRSGANRPCLILLDLNMPIMDGWTFHAALRGDASLTSLPVVLVSDLPDLEREAAALGAAGFVRKPIDVDKLFAAIESHRGHD